MEPISPSRYLHINTQSSDPESLSHTDYESDASSVDDVLSNSSHNNKRDHWSSYNIDDRFRRNTRFREDQNQKDAFQTNPFYSESDFSSEDEDAIMDSGMDSEIECLDDQRSLAQLTLGFNSFEPLQNILRFHPSLNRQNPAYTRGIERYLGLG